MAEILFVNSMETFRIKHEVNGTMILATKLLQAGFDADILRFGQIQGYNEDYDAFIANITGRILESRPRCVSFYTLWPYYHIMLRIARELKAAQPELIIILGGPQASATAAATMEAVDCVDYICSGEGEHTVVPFFDAILNGRERDLEHIPGLYYRKNGTVVFNDQPIPLCDLNTLPYWDDRLYCPKDGKAEENLQSRDYYMPIDAGRGCPFNCTFCCSSGFWRRTYRLKSPERIVRDIRYYNEKFGIRSFAFTHDAFTTNEKLVRKICEHIVEEGLDIRWKCTTRVNCLSEDYILKMKEAGLTQIELGIETGSARMQKLTNKKLDLTRAKQIISFLLKNKIQVILFFMYGFPEEQEQDLNETMEMLFSATDLGVLQTSMSFCNFNPGTQITNEYFDELVYEPEMKVLTRSIQFGYEEELPVIRENKAMFPFFFHLHTPVRDQYQYVTYLAKWYAHFPKSGRYLRRLYRGDNLRFYRDYYEANRDCFDRGISHATDVMLRKPMEMARRLLERIDSPYGGMILSLLQFDWDAARVRQTSGDTELCRTYDFCYPDLLMKRPIEEFSRGKTEVLIRKKDGKLSVKVLNVDFGD